MSQGATSSELILLLRITLPMEMLLWGAVIGARLDRLGQCVRSFLGVAGVAFWICQVAYLAVGVDVWCAAGHTASSNTAGLLQKQHCCPGVKAAPCKRHKARCLARQCIFTTGLLVARGAIAVVYRVASGGLHGGLAAVPRQQPSSAFIWQAPSTAVVHTWTNIMKGVHH